MKKPLRILATTLVILLLFSLTACGTAKVDVERLINVKFVGVDGYGHAELELNPVYVLELFGLEGTETDEDMEELYARDKEGLESTYLYLDSLVATLDEERYDLKNGDTVTVNVTADADKGEAAKMQLDKNSFDVTVNGLAAATELDVFQILNVTFSGYDGYGQANLEVKKDPPFDLEFKVEPETELANGDTVKLQVNFDPESAGEAGYTVPETTQEITVTGLDPLREIDLVDLYKITLEGFDGYGTVAMTDPDGLPFALEVEAEPVDHLSNGDTVSVRATYDATEAGEAGYAISEPTRELEVKDLKEQEKVALFDLVDIVFEGFEEVGRVNLKERDALPFAVTLETEPEKDLANGDKVKIKGIFDPEEAAEAGYIVTEDTLEIEVEGLEDVSEIDVFENFAVVFKGYDGEGAMEITKRPSLPFAVAFQRTPSQNTLSNGDLVTIKADFDPYKAKVAGYDVIEDELEVEVEGLTVLHEITVEDFKEWIDMDFTGISPHIEFDYTVNVPDVLEDNFKFEVHEDNKEGMWPKKLAIGDVVKIVVTVKDFDSLIDHNYKMDRSKDVLVVEFPVTKDAAPRFLRDLELLSEADRDAIYEAFAEQIQAMMQRKKTNIKVGDTLYNGSNIHFNGVDIVRGYWLITKEGKMRELHKNHPQNMLILVAQVDATDKNKGNFLCYGGVMLEDLIAETDDSITYDLSLAEQLRRGSRYFASEETFVEDFIAYYSDNYDILEFTIGDFLN